MTLFIVFLRRQTSPAELARLRKRATSDLQSGEQDGYIRKQGYYGKD